MKKLITLLMILMMIFTFAACGGDVTPQDEGGGEGTEVSQDNEVNDEGNNDTENSGDTGNTIPTGLDAYVSQYPFLSGLVYPDDVEVTEFDDGDYGDDKVIYMTLETVDEAKVDAYLKKTKAVDYADEGYDFAVVVDSNGDETMIIDYSSVDYGRLHIEAYDNGSSEGSVTLSDASIEGYEIPAVALKYVGTLDKAYSDSDQVFYIKATNVSTGAFDTLVDYYAANGGTLDTENSTSSEKIYEFDWGTVWATHFSVDGKISIEITLN